MANQKYIIYSGKAAPDSGKHLDNDYVFKVWKPKMFSIFPKGISSFSFSAECFAWWLFHYFFIFKSRNYSIFLVYHGQSKELSHYSVVLPKHFKTPFMRNSDLQIGPIGTSEKHRKKGLASFAIGEIMKKYGKEGTSFYYIVREDNEASRRLIESFGFSIFARAVKTKRLGLSFLGKFIIQNYG